MSEVLQDLMDAEHSLPSVLSALHTLRCEGDDLKRCHNLTVSFDFGSGGRTYRIRNLAASEMIDLIDKSLEREVLNLRALLRKHNVPLSDDVQARMDGMVPKP